MSLLSRVFGGKQKRSDGVYPAVSVKATTTAVLPNNARREMTINGQPSRIEYYADCLFTLKVDDPDEYRADDRRRVDVYFGGERYAYAWPEGHWTHAADNLVK